MKNAEDEGTLKIVDFVWLDNEGFWFEIIEASLTRGLVVGQLVCGLIRFRGGGAKFELF